MFDDFEKLSRQFNKLVVSSNPIANYTRPNYAYKSFAVLVPENFKWKDIIINRYTEERDSDGIILDYSFTLIKHGHSRRGERCTNDKFCHVYGYRPRGDESPRFIQNFYKKWPQYESSIRSSSNASDSTQLDLFSFE